MITNILDYLEQTAQRLPEKTALADDKLSLTFGQWVQQAERWEPWKAVISMFL